MTTIATIPASNIAKFRSQALARKFANRLRYIVPILMGDDGLYWVASTTKEASILMAAGYEAL